MAKGYWVNAYRSVTDQDAVAEYGKVAGPTIQAFGGRILARGNPVKTYESGLDQRLVVIEFDSVEKAIAAYESPEYQAALAILKNFAERDLRIMEGV
jgi:uncharacterized protein (DUF1330 family)